MSIQNINVAAALAEILSLPNAAGIGVYGGVPYMRSTAGLFALGLPPIGAVYYLDPANGADTNDGRSPTAAFATLAAAYAVCVAGKNDTIVLIGDGATTATARVDAAFDWAKNATHLVGISSGVNVSNRARIAPTGSTTAFANFFTVSASGCRFQNLQFFHGFDAGVASAICMTVTGSRNAFVNCHIAGMGDATSAQSAGSRSLKIGSGGSGENLFLECWIGLDTVTRTQANASLELAGATPRNQFIDCVFPFMGSAAGVLGILGTGNGCVDRFNFFKRCNFLNAVKSTSTAMTALASFTTASPGGALMFASCSLVGCTKWGDTNALANSYVDNAPPTAATSGLSVNPA